MRERVASEGSQLILNRYLRASPAVGEALERVPLLRPTIGLLEDSMRGAMHRCSGQVTRRTFLATSSSLTATSLAAPALLIPGRARAAKHTLRILQWNHFVPAYDEWFNNTYIKEWGAANDTEVIVTNVGMSSLQSRAQAEIAAGSGHDLFMFLNPPASFEDHVIDHADIFTECESRYGKPIDLALKSTYNPKTKKYYGFSDSYVPDPINYRKDLWEEAGLEPDSWDSIREGARKIRDLTGIPAGFGLAPELDSNAALRSVLASFGGSVQDEEGEPTFGSKETVEALKFMKALYSESMTDEVFTWDASSNNRQMLAGRGSVCLNAISITRTGETMSIPVASKILLGKAARGPVRQIGLAHLMDVFVIWNFSKNIDGAKQFLVDFVGQSRQTFLASQFYNFPCYPALVPDINELIATDANATPHGKYNIFNDVTEWTTNVGYPGYANPAIDEIFNSWVVSTIFADVAKGKLRPEDAAREGDRVIREIFAKWRETGKV